MTQTIPLNKLILSPRNVRKTNGDEDIESLADSIASKGLLQNLVVSEQKCGKLFEVNAGGRRYRALQLLAQRKQLARNWPVPVIIIPLDDALEASLAENLQKIAMNPADEVEAFEAIVDGHYGSDPDRINQDDNNVVSRAERIANCAKRFGRTPRYVEQRLALAALSPQILTALREGVITIEAARAYAGHPDHAVQDKVFAAEQRKNSYGHDPRAIRDAFNGKVFPADHKAVIYIGLQAYCDAGGRIQSDLFFGDHERDVLLDPALVKRLAQEKAEGEAQQLAQAEGWLDAAVAPVDGDVWSTPKTPKGFEQKWQTPPKDPETRAKTIIAYRLKDDGSGVEQKTSTIFVPKATPDDLADAVADRAETVDWQAERRKRRIYLHACRLAAPRFAGTPFEGRAFWPTHDNLEQVDDDYLIKVLIKVPATDIEPHLDAAEAELEAEEARERAEAEAEQQVEAEPDASALADEPAESMA